MSTLWLACVAILTLVLAAAFGFVPLPVESVVEVAAAVGVFLLVCGLEASAMS